MSIYSPDDPAPAQQADLTLAEAALQHYQLGETHPTFIQHNAAIVFRVEAPIQERCYLLKLHTRRGTGSNPSLAQLDAGMRWLAAVARETDLVVQTPVPTSAGRFVCQIATGTSEPVTATLQHWLEGSPPNGDFTLPQARQLGRSMAKLHRHSQQHPQPPEVPALRHDANALASHIQTLCTTLDRAMLSAEAQAVLLAAQAEITRRMSELGTAPDVWGPVHGDLHYDNVLLIQDDIAPIDFTGVRLAHYLHDIGVTVYHTYHQGPELRRAFLAGYQELRRIPVHYIQFLDAFVTAAAIENIAWNCTIVGQVDSALFQRNLRQLIEMFCTSLIEGRTVLSL